MYWPVGAPKVYALSKLAPTKKSVTRSDDGLPGGGVEEAGSHSEKPGTSSAGSRTPNGSYEHSETDASQASVTSSAASVNDAAEEIGDADQDNKPEIMAVKVSRGGSVFATITRSTLTVWQTKPTAALASVMRSPQSLKTYGPNVALLLRPDALILVVQTQKGYLITYSMATDPAARVYRTQVIGSNGHNRNRSVDGYKRQNAPVAEAGPGEGDGVREVNIRFRMVIRIDAGISRALALDDELMVSTEKPAAIQCIRWTPDSAGSQTSTELLSRMPWLAKKSAILDMVHDRPMNLSTWVTSDGRAYAIQRLSGAQADSQNPKTLFRGFCFREVEQEGNHSVKAAINARFSLIAVGCANGEICVYTAKDYLGNIPLSHTLRPPVSQLSSGRLTLLSFSPDGYCLFAGFEKGWAMWSVYGKPGAHSFSSDHSLSEANDERWLHGVRDGFWIGGGCELILLGQQDDRLYVLDMARNAVAGCYSPANVSRSLLQTSNSIMIYKGHEIPDLTALPADMSLWQSVQVPAAYLVNQWPIRSAVISADSKYVAVAGRRGLAHYSVSSGRWKTFEDPSAESEFAVRGGLYWHRHILIAAVEAGNRYQIRLYSRDKALDYTHILHTEDLAAPAILSTTTGEDSLLVYTYDNTLCHYIITASSSTVRLVQVGQIAFHGIIRAPPRVRAISWILPEDQLEHGDPSQDVATASVIFLVDGKLVLLQPSTNEHGELKYDMRVIAQNVEYYALLRDQPATVTNLTNSSLPDATSSAIVNGSLGHSLRDSLWYFDGTSFHVWSDVQDVLASAPTELGRDLPPTVSIPTDFYPLSTMIGKGVLHGLDPDLVQRRDVNFSFFRLATRTQLFLPQLLRYHLAEYNSPAALHLSHSYQHLPYFAHALEVLLHDILDYEVDNPPSPPETALLPTAISFLSSFPAYLDIIVNCTRKTELRSWRTLFAYLPPVLDLFEQSLAQGKLKTAAGYLLVLHTFEQEAFQTGEFARLLSRASEEEDWDLCGELARFLVGIDSTGHTLHSALKEAGLRETVNGSHDVPTLNGQNGTRTSRRRVAATPGSVGEASTTNVSGRRPRSMIDNEFSNGSGGDYFSMARVSRDDEESFTTPPA